MTDDEDRNTLGGSVFRDEEIPTDVRTRPTETDTQLAPEERETDIVFPKDNEHGTIFTEVPTIIRWMQSVEETSFELVRVNDSGAIVAATAQIPKGIIKLQGKARKSNQHSQMVTYGPLQND
jgi:hypothetical protein